MNTDQRVASRLSAITGTRNLGDPTVEAAALTALIRSTGATGGRIYSLDLSTGRFRSEASSARKRADASFDARPANSQGGHLEEAIATRQPVLSLGPTEWRNAGETHYYAGRLIIPVVRGVTVVALVDLHWERPLAGQGLGKAQIQEIDLATQQLASQYEARSVRRILENTAQFRVDLNVARKVAIDNLMKFVGGSSGMQFTVLRRLQRDGSLLSVGSSGFPGGIATTALTLDDVENDYEPFASVIDTKEHWIAQDMRGDEYAALRRRPELRDVKSFVAAPVLTGGDLWGVLSFAASVEYGYTPLEAYALRALANLAGAAIETLDEADSASEARFDDGRLMQAVLSNEVVVATRHEMYDQLEVVGQCRSSLVTVVRPMRDPQHGGRLTRKEVDHLLHLADGLNAAHENMGKVLETVRFAQSELKDVRERVNVLDTWRRAAEPFGYRLSRAGVDDISRPQISPSLEVSGSPDWLRIVFMHLILNSLDAFDRRMTKGRRTMSLRQLNRGQSGRITLRFVDNAGGIIQHQLMRKGEPVVESPVRAIFERYVTSKEKGTGLGLSSCRAALGTMAGSINLVDWHNGVTFDIELVEWPE